MVKNNISCHHRIISANLLQFLRCGQHSYECTFRIILLLIIHVTFSFGLSIENWKTCLTIIVSLAVFSSVKRGGVLALALAMIAYIITNQLVSKQGKFKNNNRILRTHSVYCHLCLHWNNGRQ